MNEVKINLGARSYSVLVGDRLLPQTGSQLRQLMPSAKQAIIITDTNVGDLFGDVVKNSLEEANFNTRIFQIEAGEGSKHFGNLGLLLESILSSGIDRNTVLLALGGGVVGDVSGFAASVLLRGIPYVQLPTTLLAQVDSSVGGKTAVNSKSGKNLIGSIYQPTLVIADTSSLRHLSGREMRAGYAEVIKYGVLGDASFFDLLENIGSKILAHDSAALHNAVARCVQQKAEIVAADESETGVRALLNLGHTFGHAIESWFGYDGRLLHGEAVAIGMCQAAHLSNILGLIGLDKVIRIKTHIRNTGLPVKLSDLPQIPEIPKLIKAMYKDKKASNNSLTFILLRDIGDAFIANNINSDDVVKAIAENDK